MPAPSTTEQFLELVRRSGLVDEKQFAEAYQPVVCYLAAAREPVAAAQVQEWSGRDPSGSAGTWLSTVRGGRRYRGTPTGAAWVRPVRA